MSLGTRHLSKRPHWLRLGAAAASMLCLAGCLTGKGDGGTDPATLIVPQGWYRALSVTGNPTLTRNYIGLLGQGAYHSLSIRYDVRSGDTIPIRVIWSRGMWMTLDSNLVLADYQTGQVDDADGVRSNWQSAFQFTDSGRTSRAYRKEEDAGALYLHAVGSGSDMKIVPGFPPAGLGFDPSKGPAFDLAASDIDRDGTPDRSDPDIDGDLVDNAEDCQPLDRVYMVPDPGGSCTYLRAPYAVTAQSGDGKVTLSWVGSVAGRIKVEVKPEAASGLLPRDTLAVSGPVEIAGLTNGVRYTFTLRAAHGNQVSEPTTPVVCVPLAEPRDLKVRIVRDTLELTWDAMGSQSFEIHHQAGDTVKDTASPRFSTVPAYRFTGLRDGVRYAFAVRASQNGWKTGLTPPVTGVFSSGVRAYDNAWHAPLYYATSMALAADGSPVVLYSDSSQLSSLAVASHGKDGWVPLGPPGIRKTSRQAKLLLGKGGLPHVLFLNYATLKLELVHLQGSAWESAGLLEFLDNEDYGFAKVSSPDFAIAPDGTLYVAFADAARFGHLTVLKKTQAGWEPADRRGFSAGAASHIRLAIGTDGTPLVAFLDGGNGNAPLVKRFNGTRFENLGNPGITGARGGLELLVTRAGNPVLGYLYGAAGNPEAAVMTYKDSAWSPVGPSLGNATELSLALGPEDRLFLATSQGYVYRHEGAAWPSFGPAQIFSNGHIRNVKVAVDGNGIPYVCHYQSGLANNVIVRSFHY